MSIFDREKFENQIFVELAELSDEDLEDVGRFVLAKSRGLSNFGLRRSGKEFELVEIKPKSMLEQFADSLEDDDFVDLPEA